MTPFTGLSAFPVTPADASGHIDTAHLSRLVARIAGAGVHSIGVLGSTGGYPYFTPDERARAVAAAVEAAGSTPVVAGIGALATHDVIRAARDAEAAGAAGLLLAPVSYLPLTDDEVAGLVAEVDGASALPICLYNNPTTTRFDISEDLLARLADIPNVAAVKNPAPKDGDHGAQIARLRDRLPEGFSLGYSGDVAIAGAVGAGCDAFYSVLAGTFPEAGLAYWRARGDPNALAALDARMAPVWDLFRRHGGIRVVHEAVNLLGLGPVAPPRPLRPMGPDDRAAVARALRDVGLIPAAAA